MSIHVSVVDDDVFARRRLCRYLTAEPDVASVTEIGSGQEAIDRLTADRPDLLFLAVSLQDLDGFGVVDAVGVDAMAPTVFVSGFNEVAVRAFERYGVEYLLKPYDLERFKLVIARARERALRDTPVAQGERLHGVLQQVFASPPAERAQVADSGALPAAARRWPIDRIMVKHEGRVYFAKATDVDWFEASGNYVRLHIGTASYLIRETMQRLGQQLDPSRFARIHRAVIVNLDRVEKMRPWFAGDYLVTLRDGHQLRLSRTYRAHVHTRMRRSA